MGQVIPDEAVEAVVRQIWDVNEHDDEWVDDFATYNAYLRHKALQILEASIPHLIAEVADDALRGAWDKGYATGQEGLKERIAETWDEGAQEAWSRSTPEVNGALYKWRHSGEPANPYRNNNAV